MPYDLVFEKRPIFRIKLPSPSLQVGLTLAIVANTLVGYTPLCLPSPGLLYNRKTS